MKREYVKPFIEGQKIDSNYGIMFGASGELGQEGIMSKEGNFEDDKSETGIPDNFSNIWGDEEEKED